MELIKQVASLDLCQKLLTLGVKQNSYFSWVKLQDQKYYIWKTEIINNCICSAFTSSELGELLPIMVDGCFVIYSNDLRGYFSVSYKDGYNQDMLIKHYITGKTEVESRAKMLIYLIENKLL